METGFIGIFGLKLLDLIEYYKWTYDWCNKIWLLYPNWLNEHDNYSEELSLNTRVNNEELLRLSVMVLCFKSKLLIKYLNFKYK